MQLDLVVARSPAQERKGVLDADLEALGQNPLCLLDHDPTLQRALKVRASLEGCLRDSHQPTKDKRKILILDQGAYGFASGARIHRPMIRAP